MAPTLSRLPPENSTNVRTEPRRPGSGPRRMPAARTLALRAHRLGLRVLSSRAPELAARYAETLFFTAQRHRRPAWETAVLAGATLTRLPYDGTSLPVWSWGDSSAPSILLAHGWEGRGSQLGAFVDPLVARGYRVVTFDAPGHGDATSARASLVEHGRALATVARSVGELQAVVGHSVGGAAALLATRYGLDARRMALIAPPVSPAAFVEGFSRLFALDPTTREGMRRRIESRYGLTLDDLDVRGDAAHLDVPVLVVHDENDEVVPLGDGARIAGAARHGTMIQTSGLGHRRILRAPEVVLAVADFVAEQPSFLETLEGELYFREARRTQRSEAR